MSSSSPNGKLITSRSAPSPEVIAGLKNAARLPDAHPVQAVIDTLATYPGEGRAAALDAVRALLAPLSDDERKALDLSRLVRPGAEAERFMQSVPSPEGDDEAPLLEYESLLNMPPKEWIVQDVLGKGDIAMLYAPAGGGKTFVILDLIHAACLGRQWANRFDIPKPLTVLYCTDEGASGLPGRFRAAAHYWGVSSLNNFRFRPTVPQFGGKRSTTGALIKQWSKAEATGAVGQLDLLIVDTLHNATIGIDENSNTEMGEVFADAKRLARRLGCAVLLLHHTGKNDDRPRGASSMPGDYDTGIYIKPSESKFTMTLTRIKDGRRWSPVTFSLSEVADTGSARVFWSEPATGGADDGEDDTAPGASAEAALLRVLREQAGKWLTSTQLMEAAGLSRGVAWNTLSALRRKGKVQSRLQQPDKPESKANRWLYSVSAP